MSSSVLKTGTFGFTLLEWGQTKDHEMAEGFSKKMVACFKQVWAPVGVKPEDHEVFDASQPATITVYGLFDPEKVNPDGSKGAGIEKGGGKVGFDQPRTWSDFLAMFRASGADPDVMGKPEYKGITPGTLDMEVKALPGSGNFAPKNVMVSWRNREKTAKAVTMFKNALAGTPSTPEGAPKVNPMGSGGGN